ncbi:MAG: TrkA family potassium uptake protein, partial [Thermoplasmata archaeon]|nr:TrkA family potassium uptake protein [Thermoplasmata archaeon]
EFGVKKIVAKIHDERYRQNLKDAGVTHIIDPVRETINAIHEEVFPTMETVTDIVITKESPVLGSRIKDINLPPNCIIAAIRKDHKLQKPNPALVLKEGDILSMVSLGEINVEIFETLAGSSSQYIPRTKMVFLMQSADDTRSLKEVVFLCSRFKVGCQLVYSHGNDDLVNKARAILEDAGVQGEFKPVIGNLLEEFMKHVKTFGKDDGVLVAVHQAKKNRFGHLLPIKFMKQLISDTDVSILIARGQKYERVIQLLDSSMIGERCTRCAVSLALDTSSKLYAMSPHSSGSMEYDIVRGHTKRIARIYGIEVVEDIVRGDPTIEFVLKVKSKRNQLVVINWNSPFIRRDMLNRIINDAEASVMVVGKEEIISHRGMKEEKL